MTLAPVTDDDTLPSVFVPPHRQDTDSWTTVLGDVVRLSQQIAGTDFVPKGIRNNVPATAAAMLYGREVGLPPMTALTSIHVVDGRPGMSAEGMRALVFAAGHEIVFDEATGAICRMRARRANSTAWTELAWTLDMARAAGLNNRDNWKKYPRAMLIARCTTDLCRMVFPDVIHGFRSTEEIVDMGEGVEVDAPVAPPAGRKVSRRHAKSSAEQADEFRGRKVEDAELPPGPPLPGEETEPKAGSEGPTPPADGPGDAAPYADAPSPGTVEGRPGGSDAPSPRADSSGPGDDPGPRYANRAAVRMILIQFKRLGIAEEDRAERLALTSQIVGREVSSTNTLTADEASKVTATVSSVRTLADLRAILELGAVVGVEGEIADAELVDEPDTPLPEPGEES